MNMHLDEYSDKLKDLLGNQHWNESQCQTGDMEKDAKFWFIQYSTMDGVKLPDTI